MYARALESRCATRLLNSAQLAKAVQRHSVGFDIAQSGIGFGPMASPNFALSHRTDYPNRKSTRRVRRRLFAKT
jgi:hypothetical protein